MTHKYLASPGLGVKDVSMFHSNSKFPLVMISRSNSFLKKCMREANDKTYTWFQYLENVHMISIFTKCTLDLENIKYTFEFSYVKY